MMACVYSASGCQLHHPRGPRAADIIVALGTRITAGVIMIASMSVTGCHGMHIPSSLTPGRPMGQLWTGPGDSARPRLGVPVDTPLGEE